MKNENAHPEQAVCNLSMNMAKPPLYKLRSEPVSATESRGKSMSRLGSVLTENTDLVNQFLKIKKVRQGHKKDLLCEAKSLNS